MKMICVVGTGYVGLVTGTCFAELGNTVTCLDIVAEKIARLRAGELPIFEPGLEPLVQRNVEAGRLRFTPEDAEALAGAGYVVIARHTPPVAPRARADKQYVRCPARAHSPQLTPPPHVI